MQYSSEKKSTKFMELNQCGKDFLSERNYMTVRPNGRIDYHILYIIHGNCYATINSKEYVAPAGSIVIYHPNEPQKYSFFATDKSISYYIHFSGTGCENLLKSLDIYENRMFYVGVNETLQRIFEKMEKDFILKDKFYTEICASLLVQFISTAARIYKNKGVAQKFKTEKALREMKIKYMENLSISYYAKLCFLSESRFCHVFKEENGISPKSHILNLQVENAIELLQSTDMSISTIAKSVGIDDNNYFSRLIKNKTGKSPSSFRDHVKAIASHSKS